MRTAILAICVAAVAGCTDRSTTTAPPAEPAKTGFKDLRDFDVVSGVWSVSVLGPGLSLWADGKQVGQGALIPWDTKRSKDGLVEISLRRGAQSLHRGRAVVLNNGGEVFFKNGSSGKVEVPPTGYQHQHLRYHWEMAEGARRVLAVLTWDKPGFDLELALGRGTCPHHGESVGDKHATSSPVVLTHEAPAGQTLPTGQWFAHVRLMNEKQVSGKETAFSVRAYTMR